MSTGPAGRVAELERATSAVRERPDRRRPTLALILGSGLGRLADEVEDAIEIPFADVPGFAPSTVEGHYGRLVAGTLDGTSVLVIAGRFHLYEGHSAERSALPVRLAHSLGARDLLVSNAAGGIERTFRAGDLMLIRDIINLMWRNPLLGAVWPNEERFPDMSAPFDPALLDLLRRSAIAAGLPFVEGVYAGLLGPAYETPAEVRMLESLGADAVGMSTVPEVIVARALGMRVAGVSCITNAAAGYTPAPLSHAEVLQTTTRVGDRFVTLVREWIRQLVLLG